MKITPKYCRVEWNHLHTFQSWQSHPIKSTPHSHPNHSLVSCTKNVSKAGDLDRFRLLRGLRSAPLPLLGSATYPITPSKYVEWPIVTYASMPLYYFADSLPRCVLSSHSFKIQGHLPSVSIPTASHLSDPLSPLLHTVSFLP